MSKGPKYLLYDGRCYAKLPKGTRITSNSIEVVPSVPDVTRQTLTGIPSEEEYLRKAGGAIFCRIKYVNNLPENASAYIKHQIYVAYCIYCYGITSSSGIEIINYTVDKINEMISTMINHDVESSGKEIAQIYKEMITTVISAANASSHCDAAELIGKYLMSMDILKSTLMSYTCDSTLMEFLKSQSDVSTSALDSKEFSKENTSEETPKDKTEDAEQLVFALVIPEYTPSKIVNAVNNVMRVASEFKDSFEPLYDIIVQSVQYAINDHATCALIDAMRALKDTSDIAHKRRDIATCKKCDRCRAYLEILVKHISSPVR